MRRVIRSLSRSYGFSAIVIGLLGFSFAVATVTLAVVDGVLFRSLGYNRQNQLFVVKAGFSSAPTRVAPAVSWREIDAWSPSIQVLSSAVVASDATRLLETSDRTYWAAGIDERFLDLVGVQPLYGGFTAADFDWFLATPRTESLVPALISQAMWRDVFGAAPDVVGRRVILSEREGTRSGFRVAGVLPRSFVFPLEFSLPQPDLLTPIPTQGRSGSARRLRLLIRVPPTESVLAAQGRIQVATNDLAFRMAKPASNASHSSRTAAFETIELVELSEYLGAQHRGLFRGVMGTVGMLLFLSCINVSGLLVARQGRSRSALRIERSLGASAVFIVRHAALELAILVSLGLVVGVFASAPLLNLSVRLLPESLTLLKEPVIDGRVLIETGLIALVAMCVVAAWPAITLIRALRESMISSSAAQSSLTRAARFVLIVAEVALGVGLTGAAGVTTASFAKAYNEDPGFSRHRMILLEVYVSRYPTVSDSVGRLRSLQQELEFSPDVGSVAVTSVQPFFRQTALAWTTLRPESWTGPPPDLSMRKVTSNYFSTMDLAVTNGNLPAASQWDADGPFAVVSEQAARVLWPGQDPLGKVLVPISVRPNEPVNLRHVVAVVRDARYLGLDRKPLGEIYVSGPLGSGTTGAIFLIRANGDPASLLNSLRSQLPKSGLRLTQADTFDSSIERLLRGRTLLALVMTILAVSALLILGAGSSYLFSVYAMSRVKEVQIRLVLGAGRARLMGLLALDQVVAALCGIALGLLVGLEVVAVLRARLYAVNGHEPWIWASVAATVLLVAGAASVLPLVRLTQLQPSTLVRTE